MKIVRKVKKHKSVKYWSGVAGILSGATAAYLILIMLMVVGVTA